VRKHPADYACLIITGVVIEEDEAGVDASMA
jgi:hypothetical protein